MINKELGKLIDISERIGKNKNYITLSGGNTSYKYFPNMWIKGSGQELSKAREKSIFVLVDLKSRQLIKQDNYPNIYEKKFLNPSLQPSIENYLHLNLPFKFIIHSHPIKVIALTLLKKTPINIKNNLKKFNYNYLPYIEIGKELGDVIAKSYKKNPANIFILGNHGLVIGHDKPEEAEKIHCEFIKKIKLRKRKIAKFEKFFLIPYLDLIPNSFLPSNELIHNLAVDQISLELISQNPPYPDHVVFCGIKPIIIFKKEELNALNFKNINYIIIAGIGVIMIGNKSNILEKMLCMISEVFLYLDSSSNLNLLSDSECNNINSMDKEIIRRNYLLKN